MKDFALDLKGCSKSDRKKCQEAHDLVGGEWQDRDRYKGGDFKYLHFINNKRFYGKGLSSTNGTDDTIYQMPQDWELIKADLGIEVRPKYVLNHITNNILKVDYISKHGYMSNDPNINGVVIKIAKPSTKEAYENQEAKKKEAPKRPIFGESPIKQIFDKELHDALKTSKLIADIVEKYGRRNAADVIEKDNRIKDLEEINKAQRRKEIELRGKIGMLEESRATIAKKFVTSNNELNVEIETKDKRIAELEKNLIIMCELGNKVL